MSQQIALLSSTLATVTLAQNSISIHGERTHCDTQPCKNGGVCRMNEGNEQARGFTCECPPDWTGIYCDVPYPQVKCGESSIEVTIDKRLVTDHGLDDSQQRVSFEDYNDEACHAVSDGDNYKLTVKAPFESCGTRETRKTNDDDYTFQNKVIWRKMYPGQEGEADIERKMVLLEFKCQYEDEYLLHLVPIKPVETTIDAESARGNFRIQMKLFKDRTFVEQSRLPENPIVAIDEEVCVQMALVNSLGIEDLVLTVKDCWTGGSPNSTEKHMLIEEKCEAENEYSVDVIYNGISDKTQFCFHMFKWSESMDQVYLECKVNVCDSKITHKGISQCQCPPVGFNLNDWIYPNYYNSMFDYYGEKNDYTGMYADDVYGNGMYNDAAGKSNYYYYDYQEPTEDELADEAATGERKKRSSRQKRAVQKKAHAVIDIKKDADGNLVIPDGVKKAPATDLIDIGYGPINVINKRDANNAAIVTVYNVTDEGPWFEDPAEQMTSQNIVLIAVGIALLMAMVILGVVIGAYVQCKKTWDRRTQKIRELSKVREFYQGVLRPGHQESANAPQEAAAAQKLPAFIKATE